MQATVRLGARVVVATAARLLAAVLCLWPLTGQSQSQSGQGGVPTRGYGGGAITFAAPTTPYPSPAPATTPAFAPPSYVGGTLIITSRGTYSAGSGVTQTQPLPPVPPPTTGRSLPLSPAPLPAATTEPAAPQAPAASRAAETAPAPSRTESGARGYGQGIVSEGRLGLSLHDLGAFSSSDEEGIDVDMELLFGRPAFLSAIGAPRPHLGAKINTNGDTNYGYAGLTWDWLVRDWFIVEAALGSAVHDGDLDEDAEKDMGCRVLLRAAAAVGVQFAERHKLLLTFDHATNAALCDDYQSLDGLGLRYGFLF